MSRLLIDENLPFSLVRLLKVDCVHASEIAAQASDTLLWNTARQNNWRVLTRTLTSSIAYWCMAHHLK